MFMKRRHALVAGAAGLGLVAAPLALTQGAVADVHRNDNANRTVKLDLLAINDFHGQLEVVDPDTRPGRQSIGEVLDGTTEVRAGGAAYLAARLEQLREASEDRGATPITVGAGDLIGASPLLSAAFHDEPSIEALNHMGLQVSSVGNHEFDEGWQELRRIQEGGCLDDGPDGANNQNSCPDADREFEGAAFDYLAANVKQVATGDTVLPPYVIHEVEGEKVAFVGMTLEDTPNIVTKEGVEGLQFQDEVETVDRLVPQLRRQGAQAVVVLLHEGIRPSPITNINGCAGVKAGDAGMAIAERLNPEVDLIVSGHSHQPYICNVPDPDLNDRLVTSAYSTGRVVTEINLEIQKESGEVVRSASRATNHIARNDDGTTPDATILDLIERYKVLVRPIADQVLGKIDPLDTKNSLPKPGSSEYDGEDFALGNLIADSQKLHPSVIPAGGDKPVVAFMNPGGIRTALVENDDNNVTYEAAFNVQPFNNYVVSKTLTGQQILGVLDEQWNGRNETARQILQVSGLQYAYSKTEAAKPTTSALVGDVLIDDDGDPATAAVPVVPGDRYRVVMNSFLADGGDGFPTLGLGDDKFFGGLDIDALAAHLAATPAYTPPATDRITALP